MENNQSKLKETIPFKQKMFSDISCLIELSEDFIALWNFLWFWNAAFTSNITSKYCFSGEIFLLEHSFAIYHLWNFYLW